MSSSTSTSSLSKKNTSYHLGPIPYDDDTKEPPPPRLTPWGPTTTRMVRGVEEDINGNMESGSSDSTFAGKNATRSKSMLLFMPVWNQHQGDVDWSKDFVSTPTSEVACHIPRSKTVVIEKENMGPVEYSQSENTVKRNSTKRPPPGTLFHEVTFGQSLDSIALLYDTMPSYLLKLNKRTSRVIFSGEVILVPDKNNLDLLSIPSQTLISGPKNVIDDLEDASGRKGANKFETSRFHNKTNPMDSSLRGHKADASRLPIGEDKENANAGLSVTDFIAEGWAGFRKKKTPTMDRKVKRPRPLTRDESIQINKQCAENFLKIQVTQILPNMENIEGTLLITPNAVMFETQPTNGQNGKTHDPLDLIIPMRLISSASMFSDLSSFSLPSEKKGTDATSVEMTSPTSPDFKAGSTSACAAVSPAESNPVKNDAEIGSPRVESQPNSYINRSSLAKFFGAVEDWMLGSYGLLEIAPRNWMMIHQLPELLGFTGESTGSSAVNCIDELPLYLRILVFDPTTVFKSKRDRAQVRELKVTGPLQSQYWFKIPAEWVDKVYAFFVQWTPEGSAGVESDEKNTFVMVSVDEGPDSGLINENFVQQSSTHPQTAESSQSQPSMVGIDSFEEESEKSSTNTQLSDSFWESQSMSRKYTKEWEILHHDEYSRRQRRFLEQTLPLPDINGESLIMTSAHVRKMVPNLPSRCMGAHWCCLYNSTLDGLSINTLYRKCTSPPLDSGICCMLIIEPREMLRPSTPPSRKSSDPPSANDSSTAVSSDEKSKSVQHNAAQQPQSNLLTEGTKDLFGVVLSNPPACREGFYGNGQTFVFKFTKKPEKTQQSSRAKRKLTETMSQGSAETNKELDLWKLECFNWAGSNNLFISCGNDHITIGGDLHHAKPALLIDADLTRGQTFECQTFDSPKLTANNESAFEISAIELWAFIPENCLDQMCIEFSGRILDV